MLSGTLFHWCAVSGGGIISRRGASCLLKSRIWFWEEHSNRNSIEEPSVASRLPAPDTSLKKESLELYFYRKPHLSGFLLIYSLLGFK